MAVQLNNPPPDGPVLPVMKVTSYDRVSAFMISIVAALLVGVLGVVALWYSLRPPPPVELVPLELLNVSGGFEDGSPDETWSVESPEPEDPSASLVEEESEEVELEETLENVVELSNQATQQYEQVIAESTQSRGHVGSATGTGGRPLGMGGGTGGVPREQRWFVRFAEGASLDEYARQLDHFGIELGVLQPNGTLEYVWDFSSRPQKKVVSTGKDEKRLYMTWQSGERRASDERLLQRAGVSVSRRSLIFHFYPPQAEQMLATLEFNYRRRSAQEIRRTYFLAKKEGNGYVFQVTRQTYL